MNPLHETYTRFLNTSRTAATGEFVESECLTLTVEGLCHTELMNESTAGYRIAVGCEGFGRIHHIGTKGAKVCGSLCFGSVLDDLSTSINVSVLAGTCGRLQSNDPHILPIMLHRLLAGCARVAAARTPAYINKETVRSGIINNVWTMQYMEGDIVKGQWDVDLHDVPLREDLALPITLEEMNATALYMEGKEEALCKDMTDFITKIGGLK